MQQASAPRNLFSFILVGFIALSLALLSMSLSCRAFGGDMSDEEALKTIRDLSVGGKLPPESVVLDVENRYPRSKVGALAKLMRARIRFEQGDFAGAAAILDTSMFSGYTVLEDYALWLRGKSLQASGDHTQAAAVLRKLIDGSLGSLRRMEAKTVWAFSAIEAGGAADVPAVLTDLVEAKNANAMLLSGKAFKVMGSESDAIKLFRQAYFYDLGGNTGKQARAYLEEAGQPLQPQSAEEVGASADSLARSGDVAGALAAYALMDADPSSVTPELLLKRMDLLIGANRIPEAAKVLATIPGGSTAKEAGYQKIVSGYVKTKAWAQTRTVLSEMASSLPKSSVVVKAFAEAGAGAREAKAKTEEAYFFGEVLRRFPDAVEGAGAQFELAWLEHEAGNYASASDMLTEHLARYTDRDTSYRGRSGYWAARNAERAGRIPEACALYDALVYRYSAHWYGILGLTRLGQLRTENKCSTQQSFPENSRIAAAVRNLKKITVAVERSTSREQERMTKADQLMSVGLYDWAESEIKDAQRTAGSSPSVSMVAARYFRLKGDNLNAFIALSKSYPDYAQMFPEEMTKEEWSIFYPHMNWEDISFWAAKRGLDPYLVAGLIRQESVFNPRAKSSANAYGLMQLLVPTASAVARKYNSSERSIGVDTLYRPTLNIELGTAYMKDQLERFGRVEYMAGAYNAGPNRIVQWLKTLPSPIDEFVEEVPFRETRMYIQGVVRNAAQYRRLYDESGNFRSNVGTRPVRTALDSKPTDQVAQEFPDLAIKDEEGK